MALLFYPDLLQVEVKGDVAAVKFTATRFDDDNAGPIGRQLSDMVSRMGLRKLHLDLDRVGFLTGAGLGTLIALHREVRAAGGELLLCNVSPLAYEVFAVTNLNRLLDIRPREPGPEMALVASA